jgi:hypothetical protein
VSTTFGGSCVAMTTNGAIDLWIVARAGDTVTLYLQKTDVMTGRTYRGKTSATVSGPSLLIGRVTLKLI